MKEDFEEIVTIGHLGIGKTVFNYAIEEAVSKGAKAVFLHSPETNYDLEINGIKYKRTEKQNPNSRYKELTEILQSDIYEPYIGQISELQRGRSEKLPMPEVDIISEFTLIQDKASKLSKRERDWVVSQFNKQFYIV